MAKTTILQVFEIVQKESQNKDVEKKLKLVSQFKLQGAVTDLKPVRTLEAPFIDYLLVSTKTAKFSCVRWDPSKHSIQTVSLHYYEHIFQDLSVNIVQKLDLLVDPNMKSTVCLRHSNLLAFLNFYQLDEGEEGEEEEAIDTEDKQLGSNVQDIEKPESTDIQKPTTANAPLFDSSHMLETSSLDDRIGEVIDLQFLANYRRPTIGVLLQQKRTWAGLLPNVKDNVMFSVLSLNHENFSSTTVLRLENLPYDIDRVVPLPAPMYGSLLVGCNELFHVDSGGISRKVAVNSYAVDVTTTTKGYLDQSLLELKLEGCLFAPIPGETKILLILKNGVPYYIDFEMDGKAVKKMHLEELAMDSLLPFNIERPGDIATLDNNLIFVSSRTSSSLLLEAKRLIDKADSNAATNESGSEQKADEEDDFYDDEDNVTRKFLDRGKLEFVLHDELINNGPISSFTVGQYSRKQIVANLPNPHFNEISIFSAGGHNKLGHINVMTPTVQPTIRTALTFSQINRLWTLNNKYLITSDDPNNKSEIFDMTKSYSRIHARNFINKELTVAMHELNNGKFILQVTPKHVILFNNRLKKVLSLENELKEFEGADIINSVFDDGFLMLFFSTGELRIYTINTYNKSFTNIPLPKLLTDTLITTGYITNSRLLNPVTADLSILINRGQKRKRDEILAKNNEPEARMAPKLKVFVIVTGDNRIVAFSRFHNEKCFQLNSAEKLSTVLNLGFFDINGQEPDPFIKQVILNDFGDEYSKEEYLSILTVGGELFVYKMFYDGANFAFVKETDQTITGAPSNAYPQGTAIERRMVYFPNITGYTCILVTGVVPYMLAKERHSCVRIFKFSKLPIVSFVPYSDEKLKNGLIYLDTNKNARIVELPTTFDYSNNWPIRHIPIGETVKSISYHESSDTFVLGTIKEVDFNYIDIEGKPIVGLKPEKPPARSFRSFVKLVSPMNWSVIDSIDLGEDSLVTEVKTMPLDHGASNKLFKLKKEYVVIAAGKLGTEDLAANGLYKIFEVIDIIPEPGKPETNHKFKQFAHEDTKGAVTAVCDVTGRFLISQGQKIIVRDIKDNTASPVAFLDTAVYVSSAKSFGNFVLLGDTLKSVWLVGFDAEPFRMIMMGKDFHQYDVACTDFIVKDEDLYIVLADCNGVLHLLQYNPEDPLSANGQRLVQKGSFNMNYTPSAMAKLPKFEEFTQNHSSENQPYQTIGSTVEGAMYCVFPLSESSYRRMYIIQQQLTDKEFHFCGLNPKLNRQFGATNTDGVSRPVIDCELVRRFTKLNDDRKRALLLKLGFNSEIDLWRDLIEMEHVLNVL